MDRILFFTDKFYLKLKSRFFKKFFFVLFSPEFSMDAGDTYESFETVLTLELLLIVFVMSFSIFLYG